MKVSAHVRFNPRLVVSFTSRLDSQLLLFSPGLSKGSLLLAELRRERRSTAQRDTRRLPALSIFLLPSQEYIKSTSLLNMDADMSPYARSGPHPALSNDLLEAHVVTLQ